MAEQLTTKSVDYSAIPLPQTTPSNTGVLQNRGASGDIQKSPTSSRYGGVGKLKSIIEMLECTYCMELMKPPIYQCNEGHVLCVNCKAKLTNCPTCRSECIDIRCRVLESMAERLEDVPCKYERHGCRIRARYLELKDHELRCLMVPITCPHCVYEGNGDAMASHLCLAHRYELHNSNTIKFVCTKNNATQIGEGSKEKPCIWQSQIYACFNTYFILRVHRKVESDPQYYISIIGLHSRHHYNRYTIIVEGNHRSYSFEGPIWSAIKGFHEIERVRDCLILPENIALFLSGGKGSENDLGVISLSISGSINAP